MNERKITTKEIEIKERYLYKEMIKDEFYFISKYEYTWYDGERIILQQLDTKNFNGNLKQVKAKLKKLNKEIGVI